MSALELLRQVPAPIRRWMGSEEVVDIIVEIENEFGLDPDDSAITFLLFDLYTKEVEFADFVTELAYDLDITEEEARPIFDAIRERILAPIAIELAEFGVGNSPADFTAPSAPRADKAPVAPDAAPQVMSQAVRLPNYPQPSPTTGQPRTAAMQPAALQQGQGGMPAYQPGPGPLSSQQVQAPVSLYRDALASQAYVPSARIGNLSGSGDLAGTASAGAPIYRPARVELGMQSMKVDDTLKSIFVHRETRPLQEVDYGATRITPPAIPSAPVPLAASAPLPGERFDAAPITPVITSSETVSMPLRPSVEPTHESAGFIDGIMHRIAPWHAAKFGEAGGDPTEALAEPAAAATVNYTEEPATPTTNAQKPTPMGDLSAPPQA